MNMNYNYLNFFALSFFVLQLSFAQQMPIDFSDPSDTFTAFSGSGFSFNTDPLDSNNDVGQLFNDGTSLWQGFFIDLSRDIDLDFQQTISLSFYSFDPNVHNIVMKLENGANPDVEVIQNTSGAGWTYDITFDFANAVLSSDGTTPVNASGSYGRLTVYVDGGDLISGTYLIDDIDDGSTPTDPNAIDVEYADLVWADEFDIEGPVNSSKWHHQTQVIIPGVGWANNEEQHYTNRTNNSFVDNSGFLNIVAIKEDYTDQGLLKPFTSARLNSKFAFTYGRVDVRAKIPIEPGTWPAIWMLGKNINEDGAFWDSSFGTVNWPACGEIDIMEHGIFPSEDINYINSALHTPCCFGGSPNGGGTIASDLANNFHVYSMNWSPDQITFLLDGVGFYTYNPTVKDDSTWPFYQDQYILLNVAMEGIAGPVDGSFTQSSMVIDYVRVYQNTGLSTEEISTNTVRVYPNPASTKINIQSNSNIDHIELFDIMGKSIFNKHKNTKTLDITGLNPGVYLLGIHSGANTTIKKVVIH